MVYNQFGKSHDQDFHMQTGLCELRPFNLRLSSQQACILAIMSSQPVPDFLEAAFLQVKTAELDPLDSLPDAIKQRLAKGSVEDFETHKNHMRQYGDITFTLAGVKPCALICHGMGPSLVKGLAEACLVPLMMDFNLADKGFELVEIQYELLTSNPRHRGFQGSWVLANKNHPGYNLVKETCFTPQRQPVEEDQVGQALGYPTRAGSSTVEYIDLTEAKLKTCCVPITEYISLGGVQEVGPIGAHSGRYRQVWTHLGREMIIDPNRHPALKALWG